MLNATNTGRRFYTLACETDGWIAPPSGPTSEPSTEWSGVGPWIASSAASPVSLSPRPESSEELMIRAISGPKSIESFARYDPGSRSWRTYRASFTEPTGEPYSETWPRAGSMSGGTVCRRAPLVPLTGGTGSGYSWPTPAMADGERASETYMGGNSTLLGAARRLWPTPDTNSSTYSLPAQVQNWPTPRATDGEKGGPNQRGGKGDPMLPSAVHQWPTPRTSDSNGPGIHGTGGQDLRTTVDGLQGRENPSTSGKPRGRLNPQWVESLMGLPQGWTVLEPLEMP